MMGTDNDQIFQDAVALLNAGKFGDAEHLFRRVLETQPEHLGALNLLMIVLMSTQRFSDAEHVARSILNTHPTSDVTLYNFGIVLQRLHRTEEALDQFSNALALNPSVPETWNNRGTALNEMERYDDAIADFDKAISLNPRYSDAHCNRGKALAALRRYDEALAAYDRALTYRADMVEAWFGRAAVLGKLRRHDEAIASYDKVIVLKPNWWEAWFGRSAALVFLKRYSEAVTCLTKLTSASPEFSTSKGLLLYAKMLCCDWSGLLELRDSIRRDLYLSKPSGEPYGHMAVSDSEEELHLCAKLYSQAKVPHQKAPRTRVRPKPKIRIGYLSGEFREHATSALLVGLVELHDRSRFEVFAFDNGFADASELRTRLNSAFDEIVDVSALGDAEAASLVMKREIDVLINLNGYAGDGRQGVFSLRPSPIQVNYLGFPGTIGVDYIDYLIADRTTIPEDSRSHYSEKIVHLPNCYQANDIKRPISEKRFTRKEEALPADGFVFCCFNNSFKIVPGIFDIWMRLLKNVEKSVLWLLEDTPAAVDNLRREADRRGVGAARLVFAKRILPPAHLARHRLADLFVDTLPYNAHTTASDALWAGLPVLTRIGNTFPGRVAASLLKAIQLPELIAQTDEEYEALAIELASNPARLIHIKDKLARNRLAAPLFDTRLFAKHIEMAYTAMYERSQAGLPADHIIVQP
jgi:predicted O-linked N-acetylglucosamine transferase (SPINDLY family)